LNKLVLIIYQMADCDLNIKSFDLSKFKKYKIHDNGCHTHKVLVGDRVHVFKTATNKCILEYDPEKVFIDEDPSYKESDKGSSILLKLGPCKYVFIGAQIFSFTSYAEITKFVSTMGNNDVPYPYAFDAESNAYLFIENVVLRQAPTYHDPYNVYYLKVRITPLPPNNHFTPIFQGICQFFINGKEYSLSFQLNASEHYERLRQYLAAEDGAPFKLSIRYESNGQTIKTLTKDDYIKLMDDYAKEINCVGFQETKHQN